MMEEGGDGLGLTAAMLNEGWRNAEQVADIRLAFTFAALVQMQLRRVTQRLHKTVCEDRLFDNGLSAGQLFRLSAARLAEQPENFQIEPDERDHHAKRAVPLHVFRRSALDAALDHVEIENKI